MCIRDRPWTTSPPRNTNAAVPSSSQSTRRICSPPTSSKSSKLLTNSEMDSVAPFTGLLLGQPTLRRRIKLGAFAALDQRIALRYALPRVVNNIALQALVATYAANKTIVDESAARAAVAEVTAD